MVISISLSGRWCTRALLLLCLIVSTVTRIRCYRYLFMSFLVSTSGGFWSLLLTDIKIHEIYLICSWKFCPILGCLRKVLLLSDGIQHIILMALVIPATKPKIQVKQPSHVNSSTKSALHMLSIGIFEGNLLVLYKSLPHAMWLVCYF